MKFELVLTQRLTSDSEVRADVGQLPELPEAKRGCNSRRRIRRVTGYLVGTLDSFNDGKSAEVQDRVKHRIDPGVARVDPDRSVVDASADLEEVTEADVSDEKGGA